MVEVVQDFLHYVQSGFDLNRQDILSFHADLDDAECCLLSEDASDPVGGRQVVRMKDLLFNEVLDVPFEEKGYYLQLEEFSLRCQRVVPQIDMQLVEAQRMILHQPHCRSKRFVELLKVVTDELYRALILMQTELETVWHLSFEPFFYPEEPLPGGGGLTGKSLESSGFLDLSDMFLAAKLLVRHVSDVVALIASASHCLPESVLDRERLQRGDMDPQMRNFLKDFFMSAPRLRASLPVTARRTSPGRASIKKMGTFRFSFVDPEKGPGASAQLPKKLFSAENQSRALQNQSLNELDGEPATTAPMTKPALPTSRLNEAMGALDQVVVFHLTELTSDMHRQMYWAFVRMCQFYVRWKRAFENERARCRQKSVKRHSGRKLDNRDSLDSPVSPKGARGVPKMGRRFSQQPRTQRTGSLAVPGQPAAPAPASPSPAPPESSGGRSAMRGRKQLGRSKTTALAQPITLPTGHVGFADTDEVRTYQNRGSQDSEATDSRGSLLGDIGEDSSSLSLSSVNEESAASHKPGRSTRAEIMKEPLADIEDDQLDGLD
eukprot:gnl/MRDRNA2_/MRDRNA2_101623_c0_seq1.p1 gnl/MRDRNA2_/MRDRNA2_101623_c0~~gnl/MRDRNA2_/MRDRNA2_101623_c0_seq1.p1  ORF type:complete len:549 (-),score=82.62 gnl/MRDRNA2_/MRDRNA2_101623_c0_seq1:74-1720(-)